MAISPKRPIRITFVAGRGAVKRRRESDDPTRFVIEQLLVEVLNDNWADFKADLAAQIRADVRRELQHLAADFKYHVIGLSARQKRPSGFITTVAKGADQPSVSLGALYGQDWIPRSARYLRDKKAFAGQINWFDNTGAEHGGYLRRQFTGSYVQGASTSAVGAGSGGQFTSAGGIFEDLFGPVSVQILKNKANWGLNPGGSSTNRMGPKDHVTVKVATVRVRALGSLTDAMVKVGGGYNAPLMALIRREDPELAYRLGGRYHYRPTLEPFLQFFLEKALPHAVGERIRNGRIGSSILRGGRR